MLSRISVTNYRSIESLDLDLKPLGMLRGAMGVGKSNLLSVFQFLSWMSDEDQFRHETARAGNATRFIRQGAKEIGIEIAFSSEPTESHRITVTADKRGYLCHNATPEIARRLNSMRVYHFADTGDMANMKRLQPIDDNLYFRSDGANLPAFLYKLKTAHLSHYYLILDTVRLVVPYFRDFILVPNPHNEELIELGWLEDRTKLKAYMLSDATLRFVCLATALLQPNPPPLMAIDEPGLGAGGWNMRYVANLLADAASRSQIIFATRDTDLIEQFEDIDITVRRDTHGLD